MKTRVGWYRLAKTLRVGGCSGKPCSREAVGVSRSSRVLCDEQIRYADGTVRDSGAGRWEARRVGAMRCDGMRWLATELNLACACAWLSAGLPSVPIRLWSLGCGCGLMRARERGINQCTPPPGGQPACLADRSPLDSKRGNEVGARRLKQYCITITAPGEDLHA